MSLTEWNSVLLGLAGAVTLGVLVPCVVMRLAIKALADSPNARATNFRGRELSYGLGVVWLVWAVVVALFAGVSGLLDATPGTLALGPLALLAAAAFAFGLFDDAYGTSAAKGFRGHMRSLARGVLTTGGMKLIGISAVSLAYVAAIYPSSQWASLGSGSAGGAALAVGTAILAAAAIALTGNVLNLTDLRPGRASKAYIFYLVIGFGLAIARLFAGDNLGATAGVAAPELVGAVVDLVWLAGPVIAVIGLDLRERGMLGDAGANPMGVLAGAYVVGSLGPVGVVIYFVVALALNVLSEKVSFTRVIESNAALSWVDNLGRLTDGISDPRE